MKYRSPARVVALSYATGMYYNFYWFASTARELKQKTDIKIKSSAWLPVIALLSIATTISTVYMLHQFFFVPKPVSLSQECIYEESVNSVPQFARSIPYSEECKKAIAFNKVADAEQTKTWKSVGVTFALIAVSYPLYLVWISSYLKAAEAALGGKLSGNLAGFLLFRNTPAALGLLQQAYNNPSSIPTVFDSATINQVQGKLRELNDLNLAPRPRRLVKRVLVGIIILLLLGFVLFGAFLLYVSRG